MEDELRQYYQRFFPFRLEFEWLNHTKIPGTDFTNREFAFTLPEGQYLRYLSYQSADLFKKHVLQIVPQRFEIGAVYSAKPRDAKLLSKQAYQPVSKELVFDIDLTDYDALRTCCSDKQTCIKCWQFITVAIEVLDQCFREDFGFENILWVFSGRRGIHAWVCDPAARALTDQQRRAIVDYLLVVGRIERGREIVKVSRPMHPHIQRSFDLLKKRFEPNILIDQDPWRTPEQAVRLLDMLDCPPLKARLQSKWAAEGDNDMSSLERWTDIDTVAKTLPKGTKGFDSQKLLETKQNIILEYMYPRLDVNVSRARGHLLKSPFCVHPSTGKVCVPVDPGKATEFDPADVPTVQTLMQELDTYALDDQKADWERTTIASYVQYFAEFVSNLGRTAKRPAESLDF